MRPTLSYLVCATPRSGSTLLCEALTNTGIAGKPKEYFEALKETRLPRRPKEYFSTLADPEIMALLGDYSRIDQLHANSALRQAPTYADYLAHVLREGTTPNGVFGAKVMWGYFGDFISNLRDIPAYRDLPTPTLLAKVFPNLHYIWVTRLDKVSQAVSLWKAIQTETWREDDTSSGQGSEKHTLHFHFGAIDYLVRQIVDYEEAWQQYFSEAGIEPHRVIYEELAQHYEATALQALAYLSIPIPERLMFAERKMKRQADSLSREWVECYHLLKRREVQESER